MTDPRSSSGDTLLSGEPGDLKRGAADVLRAALVAWLRGHAPSAEDLARASPECRPLLDAMSRVSGAQAVARLASEIEAGAVENEELRSLLAEFSGPGGVEHDDHRLGYVTAQVDRETLLEARALLSRPPSVATIRAREALAALAWAWATDELDAAIAPYADFDALRRARIRAHNAYRVARRAREKAERGGTTT